MRKFIAILFAVMLVATIIPAALAARGSIGIETSLRSDDGSDDSVEIESDSNIEVEDGVRVRTRTELKDGILRVKEEYRDGALRLRTEFKAANFSNLTVEERKSLLTSINERRKDLMENRQATIQEIKVEIRNEQERIKELRKGYSEERQEFLTAREKVKNCTTRTEECVRARLELNKEASGFMGNAAEQMQRIIVTMKTRVEANEQIDNETALILISQLEARADALSAAQARIDALNGSTDLNATKAAADDLQTAWGEARVTIRLVEGLLAHARYADFIADLQQMETRFTEARATLAAEGKDVTQLDADLAAFSAKIDAAATAYAQSEDAYLSAMANVTTEAQANRLQQAAREQIKESHTELQSARNELRAIIKDIRVLSAAVLADVTTKVQKDAQASASVESEIEVET